MEETITVKPILIKSNEPIQLHSIVKNNVFGLGQIIFIDDQYCQSKNYMDNSITFTNSKEYHK